MKCVYLNGVHEEIGNPEEGNMHGMAKHLDYMVKLSLSTFKY